MRPAGALQEQGSLRNCRAPWHETQSCKSRAYARRKRTADQPTDPTDRKIGDVKV